MRGDVRRRYIQGDRTRTSVVVSLYLSEVRGQVYDDIDEYLVRDVSEHFDARQRYEFQVLGEV